MYEEIIEKTSNEHEDFTFEELSELNYMECVIKESLRLYPGVPFIASRSGAELKLKNGLIIPTHCDILIHIFGVYRNEKYWPEPDKFDPDRFLPENSLERHGYTFVPFSAGARKCMGR